MSKYNFTLDLDEENSLSELIKMITPNSKILEFGPAHGRMTKHLKESLDCVVDIVEIDAEAGKEASQYANNALLGNVDGDIENYVWFDRFNQARYDYVIFADVLEHLYNPQAVIEKCKGILKDSGSILISLPNIAHNSILINLYFNKFQYTDVGLLDKTHIKFFALEDLETIYKQAGFSLVEFHTLEAHPQVTEQAEFFDASYKKIEKLFDSRRFGEVYQFVLKLQKSENAEDIKITTDSLKVRYIKMPVTLYFNNGKGYNEQEKETRAIDVVDRIKERFEISKGIKSLRFDPNEGFPCKVKILNIVTDAEIENIQPINSMNEYSRDDYFDEFLNTDPKYEITGNFENATYIEIEAEINLINTLDFLDGAYSTMGQILSDLNFARGELALNKSQLNHTQSQLMQAQCQLQQTQRQFEAISYQKQQMQNELQQTQASLIEISNSFSWRITKPVRVILDCIKLILKSNKYTHLCCKGIKSLKQNGFKTTLNKVTNKMQNQRKRKSISEYREIISHEEMLRQKKIKFSKDIKFSILTPLYNTPEIYLTEMIESVLNQTYANWELCLADGSDHENNIKKLSLEYARKNKKIKYEKLQGNLGIAGNTIEAYKFATGDFIVLLDHDDILTEDALYELANCIEQNPEVDFIYTDRGIFSDETKKILAYHYLPGYSPDFLRACNYASHLNAFSRFIINEVGFIRQGYDGSQDYEFELRVIEKARKIINIPKVLYYCRACEGSVALNPESKMYAYEAGRKAIEEHIERIGYPGEVEFLKDTFSYRIFYNINKHDKVSIVIPNKDHVDCLKRCVNSIIEKTDYKNYEINIVENNSTEKETFDYYQELSGNVNVNILNYGNGEFNFSAINNFAVRAVDSTYILFLNNDVEVINSNWLAEMLMYAQRNDVGAVGAKLYYPNETFQHIGLFIGLGGHIASHYDHRKGRFETGYMNRLSMPQNYNAVTAACLLVKRSDFFEVDGFDEVNFKVGLNDVDLCLKLRNIGKINVLTPYAELFHFESTSRGLDESGESKKRLEKECKLFREKWKGYFNHYDEYMNPNFYEEVEK